MDIQLCACGCGQPTEISKYTDRRIEGRIKGQPLKFINGHNRRGVLSPCNQGGKRTAKGRVKVYTPAHPRADSQGYVYRSIAIAETVLGISLKPWNVVHHNDGIKDNDIPENFTVCENENYHRFLHVRLRAYRACGNVDWRVCNLCKTYDDTANMRATRTGHYHSSCTAKRSRDSRAKRKEQQVVLRKEED